MVTVSSEAAEKTKEILAAEGKAGHGLRFFVAGSGCSGPSYGIDIVENALEGDEIIEKDGTKFFIEKSAAEAMSGAEIHFIDDGQRQGFVLNGGTPPPSCGPSCGTDCG